MTNNTKRTSVRADDQRKSWRVSLKKRVSFRASSSSGTMMIKRLFDADELDLIKYNGISLDKLGQIGEEILKSKSVPDIFVLLEEVDGIGASCTVELEEEDGEYMLMRVPHRKKVLKVHRSQVEKKPRVDWTVDDVNEFFVLPRTLKSDCTFLDRLDSKHVGKAFEGTFVSYPRSGKFSDLINALKGFFEHQHDRLKDRKKATFVLSSYVWLDIFSVNQPLLKKKKEKDQRGILENLHQAMKKFDGFISFFDSIENPSRYLSRAWCMFELAGMMVPKKPHSIIFSDFDERRVVEKLRNGELMDFFLQCESALNLGYAKFQGKDEADIRFIHEYFANNEGLIPNIIAKIKVWTMECVERFVKEFPEQVDEEFAKFLVDAGIFMGEMQATTTAFSYYDKAIDLFKAIHGEEAWEKSSGPAIYNNIAATYLQMNEYEKALHLFEKSVKLKIAIYETEQHPSVAQGYANLGNTYFGMQDYQNAIGMYERSLAIFDADHTDQYRHTILFVLNHLALSFDKLGDKTNALECYQKYLDKSDELEDPDTILETYQNIALLHLANAQYDKALDAYCKNLELILVVQANNHIAIAKAYQSLGMVYQYLGRYEEALEMHEHALESKRIVVGKDSAHPSIAESYNHIALVLQCQERYEEALELYEKSLAVIRENLESDMELEIAEILMNIGNVYQLQGKYQDALEMHQKSLNIKKKILRSSKHTIIAESLGSLALVQAATDNMEDAIKNLSQALAIYRDTIGKDHPETKKLQALLFQWTKDSGEN